MGGDPHSPVIVKVCGVRTPEIAEVALEAGASWLGLVLVADSPRYVDDAAARALVAVVRGRADLVGVMVAPSAAQCDQAADRYRLAAVQVHGTVAPWLAWEAAVPVIRAINVGEATAAYREVWWPDCTLLVDAAPSAHEALPGGTGIRVDEVAAAALARHRRVILAGGLTPGNVAEAIARVRPDGVDASSGLETAPGTKDPARVAAFVGAAREAFASLSAFGVPAAAGLAP
ncbi:MAG: phosphoribosylanthranilate isomerase [Candidatus Dormibacteraeota bacterium]|uniref:N-(5'-phosphoribosyl)anthranilate isomerase n=1 Tax=Candidatus Amunia macphersoniae TaxID=3127014 RepID=A0A934KD86_9BACT|nr:phosphoribosylanthranilate isomerase [Candidatus Dormibacteraeota bacterium]